MRRLLDVRPTAPFARGCGFLMLLICSALLASACGGKVTKADYIAQTDRIGSDVDKALQLLQPTSGHEPTSDDLHAASKELGRAAHRMNGIDAPAEVRDAHNRMVSGLREMSDAFEHLANQFGAAKTDEERTTAFLSWTRDTRAQRAFDDLTAARHSFQKAGYNLFPTPVATTATGAGG